MKIRVALLLSLLLAACAAPGERCRGRGEPINPPAASAVAQARS